MECGASRDAVSLDLHGAAGESKFSRHTLPLQNRGVSRHRTLARDGIQADPLDGQRRDLHRGRHRIHREISQSAGQGERQILAGKGAVNAVLGKTDGQLVTFHQVAQLVLLLLGFGFRESDGLSFALRHSDGARLPVNLHPGNALGRNGASTYGILILVAIGNGVGAVDPAAEILAHLFAPVSGGFAYILCPVREAVHPVILLLAGRLPAQHQKQDQRDYQYRRHRAKDNGTPMGLLLLRRRFQEALHISDAAHGLGIGILLRHPLGNKIVKPIQGILQNLLPQLPIALGIRRLGKQAQDIGSQLFTHGLFLPFSAIGR